MAIRDIKDEARKKLALNMHQAIVIYTVEFTVIITLIALVVISSVCLGFNRAAAIAMICYGVLLAIIALVAVGVVNFAMVDFYLATYRCKPYNIRRLGDVLARSGITKIFLLSLKRTLIGLLLTLCLIVPGVIYFIRTSMASYLLIANPKMSASGALSASNKVMSGKTGAYFALAMSLIGWYLLGIVTLGMGFIFILPYTNLVKAVYYKRNLQGDKGVYNTVIQPVSPMPQTETVSAYGGQNVDRNVAQNGGATVNMGKPRVQAVDGDGVNRVVSSDDVAPIDTLADEDIRDMNDTMRDFGSPVDLIPDVPEVPISPPKRKESVIRVKKETEETPMSEPVGPTASTEPVARVLDGTDIVETERMIEGDVMSGAELRQKAFDNLYSHSSAPTPKVNYFSVDKEQSPDDFVTSEVEQVDLASVDATVSDVPEAPTERAEGEQQTDEQSDGGMSDADFDAFLRNFDSMMPESSPEFVPLKRSENAKPDFADDTQTTSEESPAANNGANNASVEKPSLRDRADRTRERRTGERVLTDHTARKAPEHPAAAHGVDDGSRADRIERIKRERDQRINNRKQ